MDRSGVWACAVARRRDGFIAVRPVVVVCIALWLLCFAAWVAGVGCIRWVRRFFLGGGVCGVSVDGVSVGGLECSDRGDVSGAASGSCTASASVVGDVGVCASGASCLVWGGSCRRWGS